MIALVAVTGLYALAYMGVYGEQLIRLYGRPSGSNETCPKVPSS